MKVVKIVLLLIFLNVLSIIGCAELIKISATPELKVKPENVHIGEIFIMKIKEEADLEYIEYSIDKYEIVDCNGLYKWNQALLEPIFKKGQFS